MTTPSMTAIALLILRLGLAAIFYVHGRSKWSNWKPVPTEQPANPMRPIMQLLSICEPLGALAMVLGFLAQLAAIGFCIIMLGAMYNKIFVWKSPFFAHDKSGWELDLIVFCAALVIVILGAGAYSLDHAFLGW